MEASLLSTKTRIPPLRPGLVSRSRLLERLREDLNYDFILISAPAGFGKTTLLSERAHRAPPPLRTGWLSLDEGDNDPVRFWDHFIASLETLQPAVGTNARALLRSIQPLRFEPMLVTLINELTTVSQDLILVLDDYQFVRSPEIHAGVAFLLEHMPSGMHLAMATRADPPLPLARFRGRGTMLEIGADDLRFTLDEAASLFEALRGNGIALEDVGALNVRTEGWAVGLKMAALAMGHQKDSSAFAAAFTGSQRYVMDYLIEEVLEQQPADVQDFLLKTSVLDRLTAPLCDATADRTNSQAMLSRLERANLFLVPLDEPREWYRYEHLFAELLRHQLAIVYGREVVADLHRRAGGWYRDSGLLCEAINHALAAEDWEAAMSLLGDVSEWQKQTGEMITLLGWLRAIPEDALQRNPRLCCNYSAALLFTGQLDAADAVLDSLEPSVTDNSPDLGRVIATRALIASFRGDLRRTSELAGRALPLLSPADLDARSSLSLHLGRLYFDNGSYKQAESLLSEAYEAARQAGHYWAAAVALSMLGFISHWRGKLRSAIDLCEQAIELAGQSPAAAMPHMYLGIFLYESNKLESAAFHLERALELDRLVGQPELQEAAYCFLFRVRVAQGDESSALEARKHFEAVAATDRSPLDRARRAGYHLLLALTRRDLNEASRWGERLAYFEELMPFHFRPMLIYLLIAQGKIDLVPQQIRAFQRGVEEDWLTPETGWWIVARVCRALSTLDRDEAVRLLGEALVAAEPAGWVRTFADVGAPLVPALRKAASQGYAPNYAAKLLTLIELEESRRSRGRRPPGSSPVHGLLTDREAEVLRLLAAGLSNRQIAETLFISVSTAKVHVHNISEKLNAPSRTKAIARARELNLI